MSAKPSHSDFGSSYAMKAADAAELGDRKKWGAQADTEVELIPTGLTPSDGVYSSRRSSTAITLELSAGLTAGECVCLSGGRAHRTSESRWLHLPLLPCPSPSPTR